MSKVLKAKTELCKTNDYNTVYIEPYLSQSELSTQATFRTFLREIGKSDNYHVHGSKLIPRRRNSTARGHRQGEGRSRSRDRSHGRSNDTSAGRPTDGGRSQSNDRSTRNEGDRRDNRRPDANNWTYQGHGHSSRNDNRSEYSRRSHR